jgi:hypothetical protein
LTTELEFSLRTPGPAGNRRNPAEGEIDKSYEHLCAGRKGSAHDTHGPLQPGDGLPKKAQTAEAIKAVQRCIELDPNLAEGHYLLAALPATGQAELACREWHCSGNQEKGEFSPRVWSPMIGFLAPLVLLLRVTWSALLSLFLKIKISRFPSDITAPQGISFHINGVSFKTTSLRPREEVSEPLILTTMDGSTFSWFRDRPWKGSNKVRIRGRSFTATGATEPSRM